VSAIVVRLLAKKIAADLFKGGVGYLFDKRELEKRNKILIRYATKVPNIEERNALFLFNMFPLKGTEEAIKKFEYEYFISWEKRGYVEREYKNNEWFYNMYQRMTKTPERIKKLEEIEANRLIFGTLKKMADEPQFRINVFNHFLKINEQMENA